MDFDRGVLFTFWSLLRHPGAAVRAYLAGHAGRYSNPFKYLLISLAVAALAWWLAGRVAGESVLTTSGGVRPDRYSRPSYLLGYYSAAFGRTAWGLLVLFAAGAARFVFRGARLGFAEHLLFAIFTFAQMIFLAGLVTAAMHVWSDIPVDQIGLAAGVSAAWYACAATAFFGGGSLRALPRVLLVLLLSLAGYIGLGVVGIVVALRLGWLP